MTRRDPGRDRPLEESPETRRAIEDETVVPQLAEPPDDEGPRFTAAGEDPAGTPPVGTFVADAQGGGLSGDEEPRTGAEQPWDPEDLAAAQGHDPTPGNVERARRELDEHGRAAIEKTVP